MLTDISLFLLCFCSCAFILMAGVSLLVISEVVTKEELRNLFKKRKDDTKC